MKISSQLTLLKHLGFLLPKEKFSRSHQNKFRYKIQEKMKDKRGNPRKQNLAMMKLLSRLRKSWKNKTKFLGICKSKKKKRWLPARKDWSMIWIYPILSLQKRINLLLRRAKMINLPSIEFAFWMNSKIPTLAEWGRSHNGGALKENSSHRKKYQFLFLRMNKIVRAAKNWRFQVKVWDKQIKTPAINPNQILFCLRETRRKNQVKILRIKPKMR